MWKKYFRAGQATDVYGACALRAVYVKTTDTHSEYVILIAFPVQQWLHERASLLRYTYFACVVVTEPGCVYCSVRAESLTAFQANRMLCI